MIHMGNNWHSSDIQADILKVIETIAPVIKKAKRHIIATRQSGQGHGHSSRKQDVLIDAEAVGKPVHLFTVHS